MKYLTYLFVLISFFLLIYINKDQQTIIKNQETILSELKDCKEADSIIINHHLRNDSIYHVHLSQCSFISRKDVKIDKRGYAYVANRNPWDIN